MKVFLDSNVLIAALATRGICADLLRLVLVEHQLLASKAVFRELRGILIDRLGLPRARADQIIPFLREQAEVRDPPSSADNPDHGWILAAALAGEADVLVTGDHTLLAVDNRVSIRITSPRGFWELIKTARLAKSL